MWMVLNSDHTSFHQDWPDPRHPADKLVDNPTAVFCFCFFFFLFRFFFFLTEKKGIRSEIRIRSFLSASWEDKVIHSMVSVPLRLGALFSNSV